MDEDIKVVALRFCNAIRGQLGFPLVDHLVPGVQRMAGHCTLANTIKTGVDAEVAVWPHGEIDGWPGRVTVMTFWEKSTTGYAMQRFPLSERIARFADNFDDGDYPELVLAP